MTTLLLAQHRNLNFSFPQEVYILVSKERLHHKNLSIYPTTPIISFASQSFHQDQSKQKIFLANLPSLWKNLQFLPEYLDSSAPLHLSLMCIPISFRDRTLSWQPKRLKT